MSFRIFLSIIILTFFACKKDSVITDFSAKLTFSEDTVIFDTVFVTVGSTTQWLKIYNTNKQKIKVSSIRLAGGIGSQYRINVDGLPGNVFSDVEIPAGDSIFIFVEVTIDPGSINAPFIVKDSIVFETNGNMQDVKLVAWGQNAYFHNNVYIACNSVWTNDKPHVIYGIAAVDTACVLTIDKGSKIYAHGNSGLFVYGTLIVNGTQDEPVEFTGDRLESWYKDVPGQWYGIYLLRGSKNNSIKYARIINAIYGISAGSVLLSTSGGADLATFNFGNAPDINLENTIIRNSLASGIFGFLSVINAVNCLVNLSGEHNAQLVFGGVYTFNHVTLANYNSSGIEHKNPILHLGNFVADATGTYAADVIATFTNCIVHGDIDDEIKLDNNNIGGGTIFSYTFENCLLKTTFNTNDTNYISVIKNKDPIFINVSDNDFNLQSASPCVNAGKTTMITVDLEGKSRDANVDIGAYEYIQ